MDKLIIKLETDKSSFHTPFEMIFDNPEGEEDYLYIMAVVAKALTFSSSFVDRIASMDEMISQEELEEVIGEVREENKKPYEKPTFTEVTDEQRTALYKNLHDQNTWGIQQDDTVKIGLNFSDRDAILGKIDVNGDNEKMEDEDEEE